MHLQQQQMACTVCCSTQCIQLSLLNRFDVIFVARKAVMESVLPLLRLACPSVPIIFDTVDVHFVREARQVRRLTIMLLHKCSGLQLLLIASCE